MSGILPDLDGAGIVVDWIQQVAKGGDDYSYYQKYHHYLLHGVLGALLIAGVLACFGSLKLRVFLLSLIVVHLHLFCDLIGSRGPTSIDVWPIAYLAPMSHRLTWYWQYQWPLDDWRNRSLHLALFLWSLKIAYTRGHCFFGVISERLDQTFVSLFRRCFKRITGTKDVPAS